MWGGEGRIGQRWANRDPMEKKLKGQATGGARKPKTKDKREEWTRVAGALTVCVFASPEALLPRLEFILATVKPPSCPCASWSVWISSTLPTRYKTLGVNCIKACIVLWAIAAVSLSQPFTVSPAVSKSKYWGEAREGHFSKNYRGIWSRVCHSHQSQRQGRDALRSLHAPLWKTSPLVLLPGSPPLLQDLGPLKPVVEISLLSLTLANCSKMLQM